jgi:hypothetical protein
LISEHSANSPAVFALLAVGQKRRNEYEVQMIEIKITGLEELRKKFDGLQKQVNFATSKALNTTAFAVNAELKKEMSATFKGGATAYSLRAFSVLKADKTKLSASVMLRTDSVGAALPYTKALGHMFTGGLRKYKKVEGFLRGRRLLPSGYSIVPGPAMRLDRYGNMSKTQLTELLTMLIARPSKMRTIRRTGAGKLPKMVDYFVVQPGDKTKLRPGVYKRIETGKSSAIDAMLLYIKPTAYRQFIDIDSLGRRVVEKTFQHAFDVELKSALATAR